MKHGEILDVDEFFGRISTVRVGSFFEEAVAIERAAAVENHEFFKFAVSNAPAVRLWTSQEAIVTNPFSQILFRAIGSIRNVHVRSLLLPVVVGEHSQLQGGVAAKSHPWLVWHLCESIGLKKDDIRITEAVVHFIAALEAASGSPMRALGALGVGNEQMLLSEYRAIEKCFDSTFPNAAYKDFLHANIGEDEAHTVLIAKAATALSELGHSTTDFIVGAKEGVEARVRYYDRLLCELNTQS